MASLMTLLQDPADMFGALKENDVFLRPPQLSDFEEWAELRAENRGFLTPWEPSWPSDDLTRASYKRRLRRYAQDMRDEAAYPFLIFRASDGAMVGGVNISGLKRGVLQTGTIGYWIGEKFARRGYARSAVTAVVRFAFETLNLHRVEAACIPTNEGSRRVLERVGFRLEGYARNYLRINGEWQDHLLFGIVRGDTVNGGGAKDEDANLPLEAELPAAIEQGRIEPHFQPIVSLKTGAPLGFEALARWNHPKKGLLTAETFMPVVERGGLGPILAKRMMAASCGELRTWRNLKISPAGLYVAVNIAGSDIGAFDLPDTIAQLRAKAHLPGGTLRLEITESDAIQDIRAARDILEGARKAGASIALDDFGAGHSSLTRLSHLPLDAVKTDRDLSIRAPKDPAARAVMHAVVSIAEDLGIEAVAEGVETEAAFRLAAEMGFDGAQGLGIGDARPGGDVEAKLKG